MLTEIEELLIDFLLTSKAQKGTRVMAMLMLREEGQQLKMCRFLSDHPEASGEEIMGMAEKLAQIPA